MASAVSTQKLFANLAIEQGYHVPADTNANIHSVLGYKDLRDYGGFAAIAQSVAITGNGLTKLEIVAAEDANGTNATVIKDSGAMTQSSNAYYKALECTAEEIAQLGRASSYALRYVGARITCDNANSRVSVTYVRGAAKNPQLNLTASKTS